MATQRDIEHLLRRTEFVVRPERVADLIDLTVAAAVDDVIDFAVNGGPQLPSYLTSDDSANRWGQYTFASNWWLDSMRERPRPFQEKMTLFWHGHFVSAVWENVDRVDLMMSQNQLYREQSLGNYLDLAQAMAVEPAMLLYLSNAQNVRGTPNENFARELMELFTLGVGNYNEGDVAASARAWTGHNYNGVTGAYEFRSTFHDNGMKTFFGATRNWDGPEIIDEILNNNTAKRLVAARFITRKLWEFLAYPGPSAQIVNELADVLIVNDLELKPLVRALLNRPEFYSTTARQGLVRTPTEFAVAMSYYIGRSAEELGIVWRAPTLGQELLNPPNVAGWKSNAYWLTTSALSGRAGMASDSTWILRNNGGFDDLATMTIEAAVDHVANYFGIAPLSTSTRTALETAYRTERMIDFNWWAPTILLTLAMLTPEFNAA